MNVVDIIAEVKAGREVPRCQLEYAILVLDSLARPGECRNTTEPTAREYMPTQTYESTATTNTPRGGEVGK